MSRGGVYAGGRGGPAGWAPAVTEPIGVYSMYRLVSQMNSTGRAQTAAMLSASWKAPILVAPSPKKATATWPDPLSLADHAAPAASGRCAPTIAYEPSMPAEALVRCIDPPLALHTPVALLISSARHSSGVAPRAMAWWWPR